METEEIRKERVKRCQKLIDAVNKIHGTNEYRSVYLPKCKSIALSFSDCDTIKLYAEQIIRYGGSVDWEWMRLMKPLGDVRKVFIAYGVLES